MDRPAPNVPIPRPVAAPAANQCRAAETGQSPALRLVNLSPTGGNAGFSLEVARGALVALLGPAGAGKSTLLEILAGTRRGHGQANLLGTDLLRTAAHLRGVGMVQQNDTLFPHLTLAQNVAYPLRLRGVGRRERARLVEAALESVQLGRPERRPAQATAAERQRTAWARATVFSPRLLLLDEPLVDQPQAERAAMVAMLRRLHVLIGTTTLLATRVAADALALSDQVAVLQARRLEQCAAPSVLYEQPVSAAAALACGEANLLPGIVNAIDDDGMARVTLACGPALESAAAPALRVRDKCLVFVRPERIAVANMAARDMSEAALDATLLEVLHLGDTVRLRLLLGSGAELLVKRPAAFSMRGLRPGQPVAVAWPEGHAVAFPTVSRFA